MEYTKPTFSIKDHALVEVASALHCYSRDMQSYYKITQGHLVGQLDEVTDEAALSALKADLQIINQKMEYFHLLNNAASMVDLLIHSPIMMEELNISKK
ncbi:MAG: hypothetical protein HLUCCA11_18310 [Phormidesmis priestleyi Ana]|uniref:Uncharacterized protein n=1 Tax=Phormidesmis priestleyi Ana TaxID=1666911 RepID=A0A0P8DBM4_9CYAN|nr:MAG: hypothetical protein HLUCCA11_18310 [Phormidesmis priestleyi Ana]